MSVDPSSAGMPMYDAHCHLYDAELKPVWNWSDKFPAIRAHLLNGTCPENWESIHQFPGIGDARTLKAYGVHPWCVDALPLDWMDQLRNYLESDGTSVGEIGLDNWIEPRDETLQRSIFTTQLELADELGLPPSIHCVRAWGMLLDCLRGVSLGKGFLSHGFGGSKEVLYQVLDLGGYVSFSAYGADTGRKRIRDAIRACPADRILVETDAPDMVPPEQVCQFPLINESGKRLHHPAELQTAYAFVAELRGEDVLEFTRQVEVNFHTLFGTP
jgi:TatD DNase family protein